jgi:hypothetical protein
LFLRVGDSIAGIEDPTKRAARAAELFGRGGLASLGFFKEGKGAAEAMLKELEELGGGFTEDFAESAHEAEAAGKRLEFVWTRVKNNALRALVPIIKWFTDKLTTMVVWVNKATAGTHVWQAALTVLGGVGIAIAARMIAAWLPVIAPFIPIALAIGGIILLLDDLYTLFTGGDSLIGRFIDSMFGVGESAKFVEKLKEYWTDLTDVVFPAVIATAEFLVASLIAGFNLLADGVYAVITFVKDQWDWLFNNLPAPVEAALDWVKNKFAAFFDWIDEKISKLNPFKSLLDKHFKDIDAAANAAAKAEAAAPPVGGGAVPQAVPVRTAGAQTVTQNTGGVVVNVDARGSKEPAKVGHSVAQAVTGAARAERRAAMNALDHRGHE